jgi:hypothetical protein
MKKKKEKCEEEQKEIAANQCSRQEKNSAHFQNDKI